MVHLFAIGNMHVYLFGVMIALGLLVGYLIVRSEIKRRELDMEVFSDLAVYTIISSMVGARLFYVLAFKPLYYFEHPLEIFMIQNGGLSIQGAILGGVLFALVYTRKKKKSFRMYADVFVPGLAMGQFIGRLGCDVFGVPMKNVYIWGIMKGGSLVHPVQIYEGILDLILFGILWRRRNRTTFQGQLFSEYLIGFGFIRGSVEFFRVNPIWFGPFTVAHFVSLSMILVGVGLNRYYGGKTKVIQSKKEQELEWPAWLFILLLTFIGIGGIFFFYSFR